MAFEGKLESFLQVGIGCEYLWCLPLKQKPLFSAMVQVSADLDLGSSEISKSGLNI